MNLRCICSVFGFAILVFVFCCQLASSVVAEQRLPEYKPQEFKENSQLTAIGSDSMGQLVEALTKSYHKVQPLVATRVAAHGSQAAPAALRDGTAQLGVMSREMTSEESELFKRQYGFYATPIVIAAAAQGIYTNGDNPIERISLEELDAIFSAGRFRGLKQVPQTWSNLGVTGKLAGVKMFGVGLARNSFSYGYFKQRVLLQGEFLEGLTLLSGQEAVLNVVRDNAGAIGYANLQKPTKGVKLLKVSEARTSEAVYPGEEEIFSGKYPLGRLLFIYLLRGSGVPIEPTVRDFLNFVISDKGQMVVAQHGYISLTPTVAAEQASRLE